jgi:selenocysteine lyase/cysteine desulfurase
MEHVAGHIGNLAQSLLKHTRDLGIIAKTPATSAGPLVVLQCEDSVQLLQKLGQSGIVASNRFDGLRISFHVYYTLDVVYAVVVVLKNNIHLLTLVPTPVDGHD